MEAGGGGWRRISRETSPDRARAGYIHRPRKANIIYYLSRNGQLDHPHFMELPLLPNHHLRLKDVIERLTVLRGRGMPTLYSWSCKRSYKNGYVWNDLSDNDIIYPADGVEFVLKGSEIIQPFSDGFQQQLQVSERRPRPRPVAHSGRIQLLGAVGVEQEDIEEEVKLDNKSSSCRCSGVSSSQELEKASKYQPTEITVDDASPPSSSSSEKVPAATAGGGGNGSAVELRRYEECDSDAEPVMGRNSVFMQLIACGSMTVKGKGGGGAAPCGGKSGSLHKGVVSRVAARAVTEDGVVGYGVVEEKEYYSGSIVETASRRGPAEPALKKSSSYNEERSSKLGIGECSLDHAGENDDGAVKGKCIPARKKSNGKPQQSQPLVGKEVLHNK